jgi:hypothetical protein
MGFHLSHMLGIHIILLWYDVLLLGPAHNVVHKQNLDSKGINNNYWQMSFLCFFLISNNHGSWMIRKVKCYFVVIFILLVILECMKLLTSSTN